LAPKVFVGAHSDVVAERHGAHEVHPADAILLAESQRGWHNRGARMRASAGVVVVGLVGMSEHPIRNGSLNRPANHIRSDNRRYLLAAVGASKLNRQASGRQLGPGNHGGNGVQDVMLCFLQHFVGQLAIAGRRSCMC